MTATQTRPAAPNLTPVASVLGHEERITQLGHEIAALRQMLIEQAACIGILNANLLWANDLIRISAQTSLMQGERIARLEATRHGDLRLSDVLGGIEARLAKVELGGEVLP